VHRLRKENLGENWLERKIELNNDYLHHPVGEIKSFVLATIFIQQKVADEISQDPASQFFRECILNVDATAVSEKCTILCGRRFFATILPLNNEVRGGWQIREAQNWTALILLGSREVFMAKFGIESGKPWCQILLQPGYVAGIDTNNEHWQKWASWSMYTDIVPNIPIDRVKTKLRSGLEVVYVSIRKVLARVVVDVRIGDSYVRLLELECRNPPVKIKTSEGDSGT
jgi:hypothetical protein